jgi:DNA sulfur modification protein DndE
MIETVRISERGKQQLSNLKRKTGIQHWNILCRWALCTSLADKTVPPMEEIVTDSNVEMTWKTFAGGNEAIYEALIKQRLYEDQLNQEDIYEWFKIHLHRGISFLNNNTSSINSFVDKIST